MALIQSTAIPSGATDYELEQSLRLNDNVTPDNGGDGSHLDRTPASSGNRKTWTYSVWFKLSAIGVEHSLLIAYLGSGQKYFSLGIDANNIINCHNKDASGNNAFQIKTTQVFRDTSAWMHLVLAVDTTQGTNTNRLKLYLNGSQVSTSDFSAVTWASQNLDSEVNHTVQHKIGHSWSNNPGLVGYLSEVNLIDGQALTPSSFGETGDYGEWKPIEYSGSYGTNGFYLPFKQDYTVEGFSTVTYRGTGVAGSYIGGVGFESGLTWVKNRSSSGENHAIFDAVRSGGKALYPNLTAAENSGNQLTFTTDGFTQNTGNNIASGNNYVAWNWDMGGSNATNTNGTITSTVRANPTYGQSIVSFDLNGSTGGTTGHGLSSAPELIIFKNREFTSNWHTFIPLLGNNKLLTLNTTSAASTNTEIFKNTAPTSTVFSFGNKDEFNANANDNAMIAYCFHSVTGYSKFSSYSGTGGSHTLTFGFRPAFIIIKKSSAAGSGWMMLDTTRSPVILDKYIEANSSGAEGTAVHGTVTDTGFNITGTFGALNTSGVTYIYAAFADKREYAYWLDQSGNNNDWTSNNLTESDISVDSPTNNFATLNPLHKSDRIAPLSEGNLTATYGSGFVGAFSTMLSESGKWYTEVLVTRDAGNFIGVWKEGAEGLANPQDSTLKLTYYRDGRKSNGTTFSSYGASYTVGDVIGIALDQDNNNITFYKNNSSQGQIDLSSMVTGTSPVFIGGAGRNDTQVWNFGQDSSFAGNKTAQGNQDGNDIGDFFYTPPTNFLALCTKNLPDVAVVPSEHFNTVLYTGTGSNQAVTVGFQPDFTWIKERNSAVDHGLWNAVVGASKYLKSNGTDAESDSNQFGMQSFDSNGFTIGTSGSFNGSSDTYASWNWKANGSGSSNTAGSINSTVSANTDAGFSIVNYTGNQTASATVGHGLSKAPEMVIIKNRDAAGYGWLVGHDAITWEKYIVMNSTDAQVDEDVFNDTAPTASVFSPGGSTFGNKTGDDIIAYCFHSVDSYSKCGSYVGNGNADGTFVYTGFRPSFVLIRLTNASSGGRDWYIFDSKRNTYNVLDKYMRPNVSSVEGTSDQLDFTSNGFKIRSSNDELNDNGGNHIYLAFAETPFKYSNAR